MRSIPVIAAITVTLALFAFACNGDDNGEQTPQVSPTSAATAPAETPDSTPDGTAGAFIEIASPELGAVVTIPFEITGTANTFEAALSVQILADDGRLLCQHNVMATSGSGTPGDWATTMAFAPPDAPEGQTAVPVVVRALSYSARDGSEENVVTRNINVSTERPAIVITEPSCGAEVAANATLEISGYARVFEAALNLELRNPQGDVVIERNVMALSGIEESPWSTTFDLAPLALEPGQYQLIAFDFSAQDGSRQNDFAIPILLTP